MHNYIRCYVGLFQEGLLFVTSVALEIYIVMTIIALLFLPYLLQNLDNGEMERHSL